MNQVVSTVSNWIEVGIFVDFFSEIKTKMVNFKLARKTHSELANLTDRELRDIGVSRSEIPYIAKCVYRNSTYPK